MKILFTGLGSIGRRHLDLLRGHPVDADVMAYRSGASARPAPDWVSEWTDLTAALDQEPDVAFVTNPPHRHVDVALRCAEAGCDLFIEKPLSHTLERTDELIDVVERQELVTLMGCNLRFHPVLRHLREIIEQEELGALRSYRACVGSYLPDWRPDQDYRESYSARSETGGGVVLDLIHDIDYTRWLFGEILGLQAHTDRISDLDIETEDVAEITVKHEGGHIGSIHLDYYRRVPRRTIELVGATGTIHADIRKGEVKWFDADGSDQVTRDYEIADDGTYRDQLGYFLGHVRDREPCENDVREGRRILQLAMAVKSDSGNLTRLQEPI